MQAIQSLIMPQNCLLSGHKKRLQNNRSAKSDAATSFAPGSLPPLQLVTITAAASAGERIGPQSQHVYVYGNPPYLPDRLLVQDSRRGQHDHTALEHKTGKNLRPYPRVTQTTWVLLNVATPRP